jgi:spectinomycin phosphotransferase
MNTPPEGLQEGELVAGLAEGWGLDVESVSYAPVGFGSHHWDVTGAGGRRYFVTVDELDGKGWLGHDADSVFDGLRVAFDTALALRRDGGLRFVVAPIPAARGESVRRIGARHAVALFPFLAGRSGGFGHAEPGQRADVIRMLAELHLALPLARRRDLDLPQRHRLEAALRELDRPWTGGPFSEPARELLAGHASDIRRRLDALDRLAGEVAAARGDIVVTHGEPHAGNVLRTADEVHLVDWDTVGLAPPERDLWLVAGDAGELARYTDATGRGVHAGRIALYRLRWELDDLSTFTNKLRSDHVLSADTEKTWRGLRVTVLSENGLP